MTTLHQWEVSIFTASSIITSALAKSIPEHNTNGIMPVYYSSILYYTVNYTNGIISTCGFIWRRGFLTLDLSMAVFISQYFSASEAVSQLSIMSMISSDWSTQVNNKRSGVNKEEIKQSLVICSAVVTVLLLVDCMAAQNSRFLCSLEPKYWPDYLETRILNIAVKRSI